MHFGRVLWAQLFRIPSSWRARDDDFFVASDEYTGIVSSKLRKGAVTSSNTILRPVSSGSPRCQRRSRESSPGRLAPRRPRPSIVTTASRDIHVPAYRLSKSPVLGHIPARRKRCLHRLQNGGGAPGTTEGGLKNTVLLNRSTARAIASCASMSGSSCSMDRTPSYPIARRADTKFAQKSSPWP
jgi:hypothetical protein